MAKQSSKKKALDMEGSSHGIGRRKVMPHESRAEPEGAHTPDATPQTALTKREFILTESTDDTLHEVIRLMSKSTGTTVTQSHFCRIMLKVIAHAMPQIKDEVARIGKLERPDNTRGNEAEREEYERRFLVAFISAMRSMSSAE